MTSHLPRILAMCCCRPALVFPYQIQFLRFKSQCVRLLQIKTIDRSVSVFFFFFCYNKWMKCSHLLMLGSDWWDMEGKCAPSVNSEWEYAIKSRALCSKRRISWYMQAIDKEMDRNFIDQLHQLYQLQGNDQFLRECNPVLMGKSNRPTYRKSNTVQNMPRLECDGQIE